MKKLSYHWVPQDQKLESERTSKECLVMLIRNPAVENVDDKDLSEPPIIKE